MPVNTNEESACEGVSVEIALTPGACADCTAGLAYCTSFSVLEPDQYISTANIIDHCSFPHMCISTNLL